MGEMLLQADRKLSIWLNHLGAPMLDELMIFWSMKWIWLPLYGLLVWWFYRNFRGRKFGLMLLFAGILIFLSDQTASGLFKPLFQRLRPCHDPDMLPLLRLPDGCGGQFGFASSHAANTMALAVFFALMPVPFRKKNLWTGLLCWAFITGWSRIYLGMHFIGDIAAGFAIGAFWASVLQLLCRKSGLFDEKPAVPDFSEKG